MEAEVDGGPLAFLGAALVSVQLADAFVDAEIELQGLLEGDHDV